MTASQETTLDGITKIPDETQEKIDALVRAKSMQKTPRSARPLLSARNREEHLEEPKDEKITIYPFLNHTWKPTPLHLHVVILGAKIHSEKYLPANGTHLFFTFLPVEETTYQFPEKQSKIAPKTAPFWGQSFEFRGIKKETKDVGVTMRLWASTGTADTSSSTWVAHAKVLLKDVFLDSALEGCRNVDRVVGFKPLSKKKMSKNVVDVQLRFIAY